MEIRNRLDQARTKIESWMPQKIDIKPVGPQDVPLAEEIVTADKRHKTVKHWKRRAVRPTFWGTAGLAADTAIFHNLDPKIAIGAGGLYLLSAAGRSIATARAEHAEDEALRRAQERPESELSQKLFGSHSGRRLKKVAGVGGAIGTAIGIVTVAVHATVVAPVAAGLYLIFRHKQHENRKDASRMSRTVLERYSSGR